MHPYFGLPVDNLLAKYNSTHFPIQSKETFLERAKYVASQSQNLAGFEAAMEEDTQSVVAQLKESIDDFALLAIARSNVGVIDSKNPVHLRLLLEQSLETLAAYFLADPSTAQNRGTAPDAACLQPKPTILSPKPSSGHVKRQQPLNIQYSRVQKNTTRNRTITSTQPRRSARLKERKSLVRDAKLG
jgi:hypothetical protein